MTATTDDLREFEAEFDAPAQPAAPAVPAYLSSAARRRAEDARTGTGFYSAMYGLIVAGLVISMATLGIVAVHEHQPAGATTSVTTAP